MISYKRFIIIYQSLLIYCIFIPKQRQGPRMKWCFFFFCCFFPSVPEPQSDSGCQELQGHRETSSGNLALLFGVISDSITLDQLGPVPVVFIES